MTTDKTVRIGVLALQGSFREHMTALQKLNHVETLEVRTKEELHSCDGLIIPGGESTTMALVAERWNLIPELQSFHNQGRPIWGTCAGLIFLAARAEGQKQGGQKLLGGLDVTVSRNFFGAQINSFETLLPAPESMPRREQGACRSIFIRAPAILEAGPKVQILAEYHLTESEIAKSTDQRKSVIVAVRQGVLLATAFHPELTADTRWHELFSVMVREYANKHPRPVTNSASSNGGVKKGGGVVVAEVRATHRPADLPVYDKPIATE